MTGIDEAYINHLIRAVRWAADTRIRPEAFYGLLREGLPGFDPKTCYVVQKDRKPMDAMLVIAMLGGGGFATLIGLAMVVNDKLAKR